MLATLAPVFIIIFLIYLIQNVTKPKKFPPGPRWYPFIGCTYEVEAMIKKYGSQWKAVSALAKEYSTQVLGLKLGSELVIVVFGENNIRQVFIEKAFEGRPSNFFIKLRCLGKRMGITFADGPLWKENRIFTVKQLRNVGFGKTDMEKEIQNTLIEVLAHIKSLNGKMVDPQNIFPIAVMNVVWKYVAGERINVDRLKFIIKLFATRSKAFTVQGGWLNQLPWLRFLFPELTGYSLIKVLNQQVSDIIDDAIAKHKNRSVPGNDYIYKYLDEIKASNNPYLSEEQLKIICLDLIVAGAQTTSNAMSFILLSILRNPKAQEYMYKEITEVLGGDLPSWNDSYRLPYTSAFLLEVQRLYPVTPVAGPRRVLSDTILDGYLIPKESTVLMPIGDLHVDPDLFADTHLFKPERFIDENGVLKPSQHLYTFGLGRRRCPGDTLARSFTFIVLVGILQKYKLECSNGVVPPDTMRHGLISSPLKYTAEFVPRII